MGKIGEKCKIIIKIIEQGEKSMRFKLYLTLENPEISIQFRKSIISYLKFSLSQYNEEYFKRFYNEKDNIIKPYTFSTYIKRPQIQEDKFIIEDRKIELNISVADYETAIILYNSFNKQRFKKFALNNNSWTLQKIEMMMEKEILSDEITIKFQSPLCVRNRKDQKDYYYSFNHKEFEEILKINIKEQLKITNLPAEIVNSFKIEPINAKKVIIKFYEKQIECSTGVFKISGDKELLTYLYKTRNAEVNIQQVLECSK